VRGRTGEQVSGYGRNNPKRGKKDMSRRRGMPCLLLKEHQTEESRAKKGVKDNEIVKIRCFSNAALKGEGSLSGEKSSWQRGGL